MTAGLVGLQYPIPAIDLIKEIDLSPIGDLLDAFYSDNKRARNAYRFPPEACFKTLIYGKLKTHHFLSDTYRDLEVTPGLPEALGFNKFIPSYDQLYRFTNTTLDLEGIKLIFDEYVE